MGFNAEHRACSNRFNGSDDSLDDKNCSSQPTLRISILEKSSGFIFERNKIVQTKLGLMAWRSFGFEVSKLKLLDALSGLTT